MQAGIEIRQTVQTDGTDQREQTADDQANAYQQLDPERHAQSSVNDVAVQQVLAYCDRTDEPHHRDQ